VAEHVGCSVATVSRVLNGSGPASAETRARVLAAAGELGFRFNDLGRALQSRRSRTLGVLVPSLLNPVFASAIEGAQAAAAGAGYQILLACADYDEDAELAAVGTLLAKQVDGAILTVANPDDSAALDMLRRARVPYCLVFNQPSRDEPSVGVDNVAAAREAGRRMLAAGHRDMAFVALRFRGSERARLRFEGFSAALAEAGRPAPACLEVDERGADLEMRLHDLLSRRPGISALFASNDMLALACMRAAARLGLETPGALSIVGFDGVAITDLVQPGLATIATPSEAMGRHAASAVLDAVATGLPVARGTGFLDFEFRPGDSLGPPRASEPAAALPRDRRPVSQPRK